MMTKQDIENELRGLKAKIKFYKISPYMKRRYKPEYWQAEAWIYTGNTPAGYCVTEEDFNNLEYRKSYFDMIREEAKIA